MFKDSFKYYKSKKDPPDLSTVVDFDQPLAAETALAHPINAAAAHQLPERADLRPPAEWRVYELAHRPGLLFVRNPFTAAGQRYWMARCLRDYPRHPHAVNLRADSVGDAAVHDWWRTLHQLPVAEVDARRRLRAAMRWTTLGYHHNWDTKEYSERQRHPFPGDLAALTAHVAHALGFGVAYAAQAAIVNFYPQGSTLAGHTDHSERELAAPLFSFSFGQSAIFLIGGPTVDVRPTAVFLRSGDIAIMSRQSRLSYHAVPRIMHGATAQPWHLDATHTSAAVHDDNGDDENSSIEPHAKRKKPNNALLEIDSLEPQLWRAVGDATQWRPFGEYVAECRININVRQVLPTGENTLSQNINVPGTEGS